MYAKQCAEGVLMVKPTDFGYNPETAVDNEFMHQPDDWQQVTQLAMAEFDAFVSLLTRQGVKVTVIEKPSDLPSMPDAVFPNNWLATTQNGICIKFPMKAPSRQAEWQLYPSVVEELKANGYFISATLELGSGTKLLPALEGTGSIIFHHPTKSLFAAVSERTHMDTLHMLTTALGFRNVYTFNAFGFDKKPVYHTNVVLSIGDGFSVFCADSVTDPYERNNIENALTQLGEVIKITIDQAFNHFCANILQLRTPQGNVVAMSENAFNAFTPQQLHIINKYAEPVYSAIPTIERVGGGSARCMLAEVFLPKI